MMVGGLGDGCGELRASLRQLSEISRHCLRPKEAANSGGSPAGITFGHCWCRPRSGAQNTVKSEEMHLKAYAV